MSFRVRSVNLSTLSWASLLGSLPVLSAHSFASNWQLSFLNQRKGENGRRNYFMTSLHERMLSDARIEPATVRIPGGRGSDRATAPGFFGMYRCTYIHSKCLLYLQRENLCSDVVKTAKLLFREMSCAHIFLHKMITVGYTVWSCSCSNVKHCASCKFCSVFPNWDNSDYMRIGYRINQLSHSRHFRLINWIWVIVNCTVAFM